VQDPHRLLEQIRPGDRVVSIRVIEGDGSAPLPTD
jgi:hypothetical protein